MPKNKPIPASVTPKVGPWSPLTDADLAKIKVGDVFYSGEVSGQPVMVTILPTTPGGKFGFVYLGDPYGIYQYSQTLMKGDWSITHPDAASNLIETEYEDAAKAQGLVLAAPKTPKAPKAPKPATPAAIPTAYTAKIGPAKMVGKAGLKKLTVGTVIYGKKYGTPYMITELNADGSAKIIDLGSTGAAFSYHQEDIAKHTSLTHPSPGPVDWQKYQDLSHEMNAKIGGAPPTAAPAATPAAPATVTVRPIYTEKIGPFKQLTPTELSAVKPGQIIYAGHNTGYPLLIVSVPASPGGDFKVIDLFDPTGAAFTETWAEAKDAWSKQSDNPKAITQTKYEQGIANAGFTMAVKPTATTVPAAARVPTYKPNIGQWEKAGALAKSLTPGAVVYGQGGTPFILIATPAESAAKEWEFKSVITGKVASYPDGMIGIAGISLQHPNPTQITQDEFKEAFKAVIKPAAVAPPPPAPVVATPTATPSGAVPVASPGMLQKIDAAGKAALIPGRIIYTTTGVPLIVTELISPPGKTGIGIAAISAVDGEEWWIDEDSKMSLYASHDKPKPIDATHYATAQQIIGGGTATAPAPTTPMPPIVAPVQTAPIIQTPVGAFQHKIGPFQPLTFDEIIKFPADTVFYYEVQGGAYHPGIFAGYTAQAKLIDIDDLFDDMPGTYGPGALSLTAPNPVDPDPQTYAKHMGPKIWTKGQPLPLNAIETGAFQGITEGFVPPVGKVVVSLFGTPCVITAPYDPQTKEIEVASLGSGNKVKGLLSDISYGHPSPDWQVVNQQILDDLMAEINAKYAPKVTSQATAAPNVNQVMAQKHYPVPPGLSAANWTKIPEATQKSIWQHIQSIAGTPKKPHGMPQKINTGWPTLSLWEKKTLAAMEAVINGDPTPPAKPSLPKPTDVGNIKWGSHQSTVLHEGVFQTYIDDMVGSMATVFPNPQPPGPTPVPPPTVPVTAPLPPPIAQMPTEMQYWEGMSEAITLASTPAAYNAVLAGANAAYEMGVDVDFEAIHREALHITQTTVPMMAALMAESTRNAVQAALLKFQTEGLGKRGLPDLIAELQASTSAGFSKDRARKIAVTEVTRLFAEGNRLAALYDDSVGGMQWQAAADELMCPVCGERHMKIYPKSSPPPCPAHVLCRCALIPATWDYIRQNPSAWQGGPIPPAEAQLPEPQAVTAPQIVPPESEAEFPWTEADLTALPRGNIGGGHEKYLYQAPDGSKWLFKPDETAGMAELAAYRMMHYAGLEVPETYFTTMQGRLGTVQRWHKDIKGGVTDATIPSLTPAQIGQTQALHVADWIVSQHDTNQGALLMNQAGGIIAIDKGQAWKFLGKDKLDYHYNPNADRQVWGAFFGAYANGQIDMDRTAAFEQVKRFQAIPEQTIRAILGPLAAQQVKLGAWKSGEDFIETILRRQQSLGDDFTKFYDGLEAERRAWDIAHGKVVSKLRADAITPIDAEFARKVDASGVWGQSIMVAGDKIENGNLLAYYVNEGGPNKRRLVIEAKVRPDAEAELLKMCGKTNTGGAVQTEPHYNKLLPAIKHINHHLTDHSSNAANDGKIEESKIGGLTQAAITLKALGSASPIYQHYSTVLQQVTGHSIDQIAGVSTATLHGWVTAHYPDWYKQAGQAATLTEYKAPPPTQPSGPAAPIQAQDVKPWHLEMTVQPEGLTAGAIQVSKKQYYGAGRGIEMDLGDGVEAVYTMHSTQNQYSQTGRLQIHLPGWTGDPRQVETILNKMDKLGLDVQLATKADAKLTYLYQMAHTMNLRQNPDYQAEVLDPIKTNRPSVADRTALYKTYLKKHMTPAAYKQLDDESVFMPKYDRTFKNGKRSVEGGWAYWERCDITVADLEREMPGYKLTHSHALIGYTGEAASFIAKCLKTNGTLANTEERVRMDIWVPGQGSSSTADMETGGAMGLFTRIRKSRGDDYDFDKRLLLRTGNYSFDRDRYGKCKEDSYNERYSDIKGWKKIAPNGGNETVIKNSFAMFDWVQTIFVNASDRQRTINMLKAAGIDEVRGKRIEDIVEAR